MMQDAERACQQSWPRLTGTVESVSRATMLATTMPPPSCNRQSVQMLARQLGVSGPLEAAKRRGMTGVASRRWRSGRRSWSFVAPRIIRGDTLSAGGVAGPGHLQTALGWLRRFVKAFPSRRLLMPYAGVRMVLDLPLITRRLCACWVTSSARTGQLGRAVRGGSVRVCHSGLFVCFAGI